MRDKNSTFVLIVIVFTLSVTACRKDEKPTVPLTDIEGNTYKTVQIGSQLWMAENLKTTRLNDGTDIPLTKDAPAWSNLTTPGYCWYNNDAASSKDIYGALYNGYAVSTGKLCPDGWHVPEKNEWRALREFLGDSARAGGKLKEAGIAHWLSPNKGADNSSGFGAVAGGLRYFEGTFASILSYTSIWSATEVEDDEYWYIGLYYAESSFIMNHRNKKHGFSVRCIKD